MSEVLSSVYKPLPSGGRDRSVLLGDRLLTKREFLKICGTGLCVFSAAHLFGFSRPSSAQMAKKGLIKMKLSPYYTPLSGGDIRCELCPRRCRVSKGDRGYCRVRENRDGKYYSLVYGNPCAVHLDPIEKKPLFHVLPSTESLSLATAGCNLKCKFCQNWEISQVSPDDVYSYDFPPEMIVKMAGETGARSIAYTYVEPTIFYEYMIDICKLAKKAGILNVCHSNAFINPEPLGELCKVMDAANCDLKGFTEDYYGDMCSGQLSPVLETLKTFKRNNVHLEITNLVVPTRNDNMAIVKEMCLWIKNELGEGTPVHFSRFYPLYKLRNLPPTPVATLEKARKTALSVGLHYVYIGNIPGHEGEHTFCPGCGKLIIKRVGYMVGEKHIEDGKCAYCRNPIPGIWA